MFFPNSFSYGVLANIGSGAVVRGRFRGSVPEQGSGKVLGQVPGRVPRRFRAGSGGPGRILDGTFQNELKTIWLRTGGQGSGTVPLVNQ